MKNLLVIMLLSYPALSYSDTVTIGQKNKTFTVDGAPTAELSIAVGDTIRFVNEDDFFHNVFSLSDIQMFDLGSFPKGEHREIVADKAGTIEVECAIHPEMAITIKVK